MKYAANHLTGKRIVSLQNPNREHFAFMVMKSFVQDTKGRLWNFFLRKFFNFEEAKPQTLFVGT